MNGADRLCDTLLASGIDVCFANPGTSEMHFVAALDRKPAMRCVLGLSEGVVTGAAYGYGLMADRPAATLLHTGPGLANGLANLHNARRAFAPIVNIVGDHASFHLPFDAPLASDIESLARPMSHWVGRVGAAGEIGAAVNDAIRAAAETPGVATLIVPADSAWGEVAPASIEQAAIQPPRIVDAAVIGDIAAALDRHRGRAGFVLSGKAARADAMAEAGRIAAAFGARLFREPLCARVEQGRGVTPIERIPYPIDGALAALRDIDLLILVGGREPVAFFAYPGKPSRLVPEGCRVATLAGPGENAMAALVALAEASGVSPRSWIVPPAAHAQEALPEGLLTAEAVAAIVTALLPERAIVCDEGLTAWRASTVSLPSAARHDYLMVPGGAIGLGIPMATGAAIACPDRKVIGLQADGSAMYTLQGLWTQARERLDVTTVIYSNRSYAILKQEMRNLGTDGFGRNAARMMNLDDPALDWVALARGMGVEAARAETAEGFADLCRSALGRPGPFLIEAVTA